MPSYYNAHAVAAGFDWSATYDTLVVACVHAADLSALALRARLAQRRPMGGGQVASCAAAASAARASENPEHGDPGEALWRDVLDAWRAYRRWAAVVVAAAERLAECADAIHLLCQVPLGLGL